MAGPTASRRSSGVWTADGFGKRTVAAAGPFDVICANILARPLRRMAPHLARHLASGDRAILSGLLVRQEAGVLAAYRASGLTLDFRIRQGAWSTLIVC